MVRPALLSALPVLALSLSACAPTSAPSTESPSSVSARRCILHSQVQSFTEKNEVVYLHGPGKSVFQLEPASFCPELDTTMQLALVPQRGTHQVCVGDWITLVAPYSTATTLPCRVRIVRSLSPADIAAMPEKDRP